MKYYRQNKETDNIVEISLKTAIRELEWEFAGRTNVLEELINSDVNNPIESVRDYYWKEI